LTLLLLLSAFAYCHSQDTDCDYVLEKADVRNVIFVGRSRSGKTTSIEVLKDKNHSPKDFTVLRDTLDVGVQSFTMNSAKLHRNLNFNIMDTPGLFERAAKDDRRTNEVIVDVIKKCIDMEITKIHHVYFVMSLHQGLSEEDLKSFDLFTELFMGMENKISIILSFSQEIAKQEQYDHYIEQFRNKVPELKPMYDLIGGRIFFLGAAKESQLLSTEANEAYMKALRSNVHKQRAVLFEHIIGQNTTFNVKNLNVYREKMSLFQRIRSRLAECCQATDKCLDLPEFDAFISNYIPTNESTEKEGDDDDDDEDEGIDYELVKDGIPEKADL